MKFLTLASRLESLKAGAGLSAPGAMKLSDKTRPMIVFIGCHLRKKRFTSPLYFGTKGGYNA
jgi:hypothetical protein